MGTNLKIWVALGITVLAVLAAIWQIANVRGMRSRGRRRSVRLPEQARGNNPQRRSDSRDLTGTEKRLYNESQKLLGQGKVTAAARILEQLGMQRESIQVLEDHGLIHDAAKILLRMQRANRAGVIYARHGMWEDAAKCFKMANMPLEVAKCAREAGDLTMAAEYFEKVGRFENAAECFEQLGDFQKAARHFTNVGQKQRAIDMYNRLAAAAENLMALDLEEQELQHIVDYLGDGHTDPGLADLAVSRNKLSDVILNLVGKGLMKQASELYLRATSDIGPLLMAEVNYQNRSAPCLAEVFLAVANFHYAGMIFERMGTFDRAADAFERAEDFERAAYCYERIGADQKAKVLKEKARHTPYQSGRGASPGFALANVTTLDEGNGFAATDDESTAVMDPRRGQARPMVTPPPPLRVDEGAAPTFADEPPPPPRRPAPPPALSTPPPPRAPTRGPRTFSLKDDDGDGPDDYSPGDELSRDLDRSDAPRVPAPPGGRSAAPPAPPQPPRAGLTVAAPIAATAPIAAVAPIAAAAPIAVVAPIAAVAPIATVASVAPIAPATSDDDDDDDVHPELPPRAAAQAQAAPISLDDGRAVFHKAKFFGNLDFEQKTKIWNIGVTLTFDIDQTILTYDDEPRGVYVIIQGSVSCYKHVGGKEAYIDQMAEGESFGELWLLADQPTSVRFVATKASRIRVIDRDVFDDLLDRDGTIARKVYKRFTMRLLKRLLKPQNNRGNQAAS